MLSGINLKKTGERWDFPSEAVLEDFAWANLPQLLGLTPLRRQYSINNQFCDILALGKNQQLVVLELKNTEDRYIVQQLTRYYHALLEEKPLFEEINYEQPIRLIAIAPSFHRDNYTDRKYNHLLIEFLQFKLLTDDDKCYLQVKDLDKEKVSQLEIPYQEKPSNAPIPDAPRKLFNFLAKCNEIDRNAILKIRNKIFSFDSRIKEVVEANSIEYAKGKSYPCAEIYFDKSKDGSTCTPYLFLRLPDPDPFHKPAILRMSVENDDYWNTFSALIYCKKGITISKGRGQAVYNYPRFIEWIERWFNEEPNNENFLKCYQNYKTLITTKSNSIDLLTDIAFKAWLTRLAK
ncbi:MAG TPA: endonuclease NucS domain-containing protein [Oculatellaceae cyanobacterium]|jgi:RecB family endonuclease NucS